MSDSNTSDDVGVCEALTQIELDMATHGELRAAYAELKAHYTALYEEYAARGAETRRLAHVVDELTREAAAHTRQLAALHRAVEPTDG